MKIVKNEDAVSPVIGVILMVAITVILAAVIAAFVFNIGGTQTKTPVASLTATASLTTKNITISHSGGDSIDLSKVKALVEQGDSRNTISQLNTSSQVISVGDKLKISQNATVAVYVNNVNGTVDLTSSNPFVLAAGIVTVTLIDTDSSQQIARLQATVS